MYYSDSDDSDSVRYSKPSLYQFSKSAYFAAARGDLQTLSELFPNPDVIFDGETPLTNAVKNNQYSSAEFLLKRGASPNVFNDDNITPLMAAVENGNHRIVRLLLKHGGSISIIDNYGNNALSIAVDFADQKMIKLLLSKSDLNELDKGRWNPLMIAVHFGHEDVLRLLIEYGALIDKQGENGRNALFMAVYQNRKQIAKFLLSKGANPNLKDSFGQTPLLMSINKQNDPQIIKDLLKYGADPRVPNDKGIDAYEYLKKIWNKKSETLREIKVILNAHRVGELKRIGGYLSIIPTDVIRLVVEIL